MHLYLPVNCFDHPSVIVTLSLFLFTYVYPVLVEKEATEKEDAVEIHCGLHSSS